MSRILALCILTLGVAKALAQQAPADAGTGTGSAGSGSDACACGGSATGSGSGSAAKPDPRKTFDDLDAKTSDFDKLKTPSSPAFTLLGVSPTEIQRPSTPKAVAMALGQFVSGTSLAVPKNFALEVTPFWLAHHPDLTLEDYQKADNLRWLYTMSLSVGTSQNTRTVTDAMGTSTDHTDSDVAIGLRSTIYQSKFSTECIQAVQTYAEAITEAVDVPIDQQKKLEAQYGKGTPDFYKQMALVQTDLLNAAIAKNKKELEAAPKCISDGTLVRGTTFALAGAFDWLLTDSEFTTHATSWHRAGLWADLAQDWSELSIAGMARVAAEKEAATNKAVDVGVQVIYKGSNWAASIEGIGRYRLDAATDPTTYKADIAGEYELTDGTWLSLSFGKDFTFVPSEASSLFTLANVQWNLGTPTIGN